MRLTQMTDYALRLLMHAARHPDRLVTIQEVAQVHGLSQAHLMKITQQLAHAQLLATVRGRGGGFRLARDAGEIGLGAVVRATEPDFALVECFGGAGHGCLHDGHCRLAGAFEGALTAFLAHLDRYTLADLVVPADGADAAAARAVDAGTPRPIVFAMRAAPATPARPR